MGLPWKRQQEAFQLLEKYFAAGEACLNTFQAAMLEFLNSSDLAKLLIGVEETHRLESLADQGRRNLETFLFERNLLPDYREDILHLVDTYDDVPDTAELLLRNLEMCRVTFPAGLVPDLKELTLRCVESNTALLGAVRPLFREPDVARKEAAKVKPLEGAADTLQHKIIRAIFAMPTLDTAQKMLLREMVDTLADISDLAEICADQVTIFAIKWRL